MGTGTADGGSNGGGDGEMAGAVGGGGVGGGARQPAWEAAAGLVMAMEESGCKFLQNAAHCITKSYL